MSVSLGVSEITAIEMGYFLERHRLEYPETYLVETSGRELIKKDFPIDLCRRFVRQVCRWGGYSGIAARILSGQPNDILSGALRVAYSELQRNNQIGALNRLSGVNGLGRPSFASKHLRFLAPDKAGVMDSVISRTLGFSYSADGYSQFIEQCQIAKEKLNNNRFKNPIRGNGLWLVADIEAAFYAKIRAF